MELAQVDIRAHRARLEGGEKMLRLRLNNNAIANQIQCRFPRRALPAILGWAMFGLDERIQSVLPRAG